jgi:aldose 1-epimerase
MTQAPLSGVGYTIAAGEYEAEIASVGATLRSLRYRGRDLVLPFDARELRPAMQGAVLAPWPNRLADGTYEFDGVVHHLPLTEPATRNAAHGLAAWLDFAPVEQSDHRLVLRARVEPQPGYPWRVRIDVAFELTEHGFSQRVTASNESAGRAPIGLGVHPYVLAAEHPGEWHAPGALDDWRLTLPASEVMLVSEDRMLPVGMVRVDEYDAGALDFRRGRRIGSTQLNHAFTALDPDSDGWATITVENDRGNGVELSWDARASWVQVYSSDFQPAATRRQGIAIEPMTCPPDAFNSGVDRRVVPSGGHTGLEWRLRAI